MVPAIGAELDFLVPVWLVWVAAALLVAGAALLLYLLLRTRR